MHRLRQGSRILWNVMVIISKRSFDNANRGFPITLVAAIIFCSVGASSVAVPITSCYALDNTSHIHDFSNLIGQIFEYDDDKDPDLVIRFCKDVETRSQPFSVLSNPLNLKNDLFGVLAVYFVHLLAEGYVDFGRFDKFNHFIASSGRVNFVQDYYNGDLMKCEKSYDKLGRTAEVNIICGKCPNGQCAGGLGCICNVTYESTCRILIDLAIPCVSPGPRVFEGFTVGFHPRSWEIVYNGMTQLGYEKAYDEFSFKTEQTDVALYITAVASLSGLVQKPTIKISPEQGLDVQLSGSGAKGSPPTTLSPTMILVNWRCEKARDSPYEVEITIPVEGYDPVQFTFAKMCDHGQSVGGEATRGWAIFGILSCIFIVAFSLFCCGGFIYRTRVGNHRGLDALPGMAVLSACLETVSGGMQSQTRTDDANSPFVNQAAASWDRQQTSTTQGTWKTNDRTYGSI